MNKNLQTFWSLFLIFGEPGLSRPASMAVPAPQRVVPFEAELEQRGFTTVRTILLTDGRRFREKVVEPKTGLTNLYDGNARGIVWSCDLQRRTAGPLLSCMFNALYDEVKQHGEPAVRKRYSIPASYSLPQRRQLVGPQIDLPRLNALGVYSWKPLGTVKQAGFACREMSARGFDREFRIRLEPKSGTILRFEEIVELKGSPRPPVRNVIEVKKIRFLKSVDKARFQIPPGTTVRMYRAFDHVKLPPGVKREVYRGPGEEFGLVFQPRMPGPPGRRGGRR